jgi:hypothetical protein
MLSIRIPNVKEIYCPNKVLTPLRGQPTYESLKTLNKQLKANAASVPSTLVEVSMATLVSSCPHSVMPP